MRHAASRDACEGEVVKALEEEGWGVFPLSAKDFPDLFCTRDGAVLLVECKKLGGALRPGQAKLHAALHALGFLVPVAGSAEEARAASRGQPARTYLNMPVEERGTRGPRGVRLAGGVKVRARRGSRRTPAPGLSPATAPSDAMEAPSRPPGAKPEGPRLPVVEADASGPVRLVRPPGAGERRAPKQKAAKDLRSLATPATYPAAPKEKP